MVEVYAAILLIGFGIFALLAAFLKGRQIIGLSSRDNIRNGWKLMLGLNLFFIPAYAAIIAVLLFYPVSYNALIIGIVCFSGSVFVYVTVKTGLDSVKALQESLVSAEEKEALLRELHHRVKNNLQVILSILKLQRLKTSDKESDRLIAECEARIFSMALVHENLYRSHDFSYICFRTYIESLVKELMGSKGKDHSTTIHTVVDCAEEHFNIETLVPIGLIMNELVMNSIRHAFHGKKEGTIAIEAKKSNGDFMIRFSDNGTGFADENIISSGNTVGLELISCLIEQIDGELQIIHKNGTTFIIKIPLN
jgi:two-component sensor histidine kinase